MCMTRDKRNASDFIVQARWTVMPVCEQTEERKNRVERKITRTMDLDIFTLESQLYVWTSMS